MVADTMTVDTRRVYGPHESSEPLNLTVEGQDSIFWIRSGTRATPGTTTQLRLRKSVNPWQRMSDDQFVASVENVIPNPPFRINVQSNKHKKVRDSRSFRKIGAESLKDYSWEAHDNIKEYRIDLTDTGCGFVGSAIVAVLEMKGKPVSSIEMTTKSIEIEGRNYELQKGLRIDVHDIELRTTSITIDDEGNIETSNNTTALVKSRSKLSLHGIEVPTSLFPDLWLARGQITLEWPLPLLIVIDICGERDLDLNSARSQILRSEKWVSFEDALTLALAQGLANQVSAEYWEQLKEVMLGMSVTEALQNRLVGLVPEAKGSRSRSKPRTGAT